MEREGLRTGTHGGLAHALALTETLREARAVSSAFVGEGAALYQVKGFSAATGREKSRETVGSWNQ